MYAWIWRHLAGAWWAKSLQVAVLIAGVITVLFLVVFPWAQQHIPFLQVTVEPGTSASAGLMGSDGAGGADAHE